MEMEEQNTNFLREKSGLEENIKAIDCAIEVEKTAMRLRKKH